MPPEPSLRSLRLLVTERQRAILDEVWEHIKRTNIGLPERPLLDKHGKVVLLGEVAKLGGTVIWSGLEENKERYNLGVVGIFLTSDGERLEKVVEHYLNVLRDAYAKNKEIEQFSSKDLASWAPDLTANDLVSLRHILYRAHGSLASRLGGWNQEEWQITVDNEVVELKNISDWNAYINSKIMQWYDPKKPVGEAARMGYQASNQLPTAVSDAMENVFGERRAPVAVREQSALHPWPVVRGFLLQSDSYDVPKVIDRTGLVVDWRLTEKQDYSHKTRLAAYRARIDTAYQNLPSEEDRLRVAYIVAREISDRISVDELNNSLRDIGWQFRDSGLVPATGAVRELFFGDRSEHDAYVEIRALLQRAEKDIVIVDPYIDQSILTLLSACIKPGMSVRLLTSKIPNDFVLEAKKWVAQHAGLSLEVRTTKEFHDRFVVLDNTVCWHVGASIKDAGQKAFMLSQLEDDNNRAALIAQVTKSWGSATVVVG